MPRVKRGTKARARRKKIMKLARGMFGGRHSIYSQAQQAVGLAAAVLCTAFCYTGIMMFISALGENPRAVSGAGWAILLGTSMIGGSGALWRGWRATLPSSATSVSGSAGAGSAASAGFVA